MDKKLLITPIPTPLGLPSEEELEEVGPQGLIRVPTGEGQMIPQQLRDGAPEHFHHACRKLLESLKGKTDAIIVGGTEGFGIKQYTALLTAMKKACPHSIRIFAGLLGEDEMLRFQHTAGMMNGIYDYVLGLNRTGENESRFATTRPNLRTTDRLWLHQTFQPASLAFIEKCMEDSTVVGIIDSSEGTDEMRLRHLLNLKSGGRDFQVLAGNEEVYGNLRDPEFDEIDGLVSEKSIADAELYRRFIDNPRNGASEERQKLDEEITRLPRGRRPHTLTERLENNRLGLKIRLLELGIFEPQHVGRYSPKPG